MEDYEVVKQYIQKQNDLTSKSLISEVQKLSYEMDSKLNKLSQADENLQKKIGLNEEDIRVNFKIST